MPLSVQDKIEKYSIAQLEILCRLNFNSDKKGYPEAKAEQDKIVDYLGDLFDKGGPRAAPDALKAKKYKDQAKGVSSSPSSMLHGANSYYTASSWFNFIRLYALRALMVSEYFLQKTLIPRLYGIGGVLYAFDFLFDAFDILQSTVRPAATEEEKKMSFWALRWQRFKNAATEEGRLPHMANALRWGVLNALTFFIFGGTTAVILTLTGLGIDSLEEFIKGGKDYLDHKFLLDENAKELKEKNDELENLNKTTPTNKIETQVRDEKIAAIQKDIHKLEACDVQLNEEMSSCKISRAYTIATTLMVVGGIGLMLFPPTMAIGVGLTIFGLGLNLGEKAYEAYKFFHPAQSAPVVKKENEAPVVAEENTSTISEQPGKTAQPGINYENMLNKMRNTTERPILEKQAVNIANDMVPVQLAANSDLHLSSSNAMDSKVLNAASLSEKINKEAYKSQSVFNSGKILDCRNSLKSDHSFDTPIEKSTPIVPSMCN